MEAELFIDNIGGLKDSHTYKFKKGALNIIEAPNSSGKTSIIKSITALLSIPSNGHLKKIAEDEAKNLGLKSNERNPQQGFVNVHSEIGKAGLVFDGKKLEYVVKQDGEIIKIHNDGNQDFLLSGILSNDSRILKQLNSIEGNEVDPSDFSWAVTELSSAKIYDEESSYLKDNIEEFKENKYLAEQKSKMLENLDENLKKLSDQEKQLKKEKDNLQKLVKRGGVDSLVDERERINQEIENRKKRKSEVSADLEKSKIEKTDYNNEIDKLEDELRVYKGNINNLEKKIGDLELKKGKYEQRKELEVPRLKEQRNLIDGELNLLTTAFNAISESEDEELECPLCHSGNIQYSKIKNHLQTLERKKSETTKLIGNILSGINSIIRELDELLDDEANLKQKIQNLNSEKENYLDQIENCDLEIDNMSEELERLDVSIKNYQNDMDEIRSKFSKTDEQLNNELTEKEEKLSETKVEMRRISQEKDKSSLKIGEYSFEPKEAKKIYEKLIKSLQKYVDYVEMKSEDQKEKARENFNENITQLIKNLGFKEFRNIKLNKKYKLYVERLDEETDEYVLQQVKTLSTSEKSAIAIILQIALKQMYIPNIDFLILDDVIANFDEDKKIKILDYLSEKAKEEGWYIILTNLSEENNPLKITTR